ncbi:MAG: flagellar hook-basal body complex protein FliE [Chlorobi bacterium]|nr:flagellar hook-basal body complex protein FliE [Chlorobiota bacterium]
MGPIGPLDILGQSVQTLNGQPAPGRTVPVGPTFDDTLRHFIESVNELQVESGDKSARFIKGEAVDLHDVMIAAEKAKTSFQLLMELRNKALDLYREAMRIQV